jgi:hypothetical protein
MAEPRTGVATGERRDRGQTAGRPQRGPGAMAADRPRIGAAPVGRRAAVPLGSRRTLPYAELKGRAVVQWQS